MEHLTEIISFLGILGSLKQGIAAGTLLAVVNYFREKKKTEDRIKIMRSVSLLFEYQFSLLECHNHMHPEGRHDMERYFKRIIEIGIPVPIWNTDKERR